MTKPRWMPTSERPGDGDSIWVAVIERDGVSAHVDYAQTFVDLDGLILHRYEPDDYQQWPPTDVLAWMPCNVPEFFAAHNKTYECGQLAALQGCYRILCCPESPEQESEWLRGYDSVPPDDRGSVPLLADR